jgi:hypothetical protein
MSNGYTPDSPEQWRVIEGWPGYEVSSFGRVISYRRKEPRVLIGGSSDGYRQVYLHRADGYRRMARVHSLVAAAFIGPRPDGLEVRHLDGNRTNNAATNLEYATHTENMRDRVRHGTHPQANRTHCPQGHPYSPENVYADNGGRKCRICVKARVRAYKTNRALRAANVPTERAA